MLDTVRRTIAKTAYHNMRTMGDLDRFGIEPQDLAQEGFLHALRFGKGKPALQIFVGRQYMRQLAAKAIRKELPTGPIFTDHTHKTPKISRHLSTVHKDFDTVDARDLLAFVLPRLNLPQWKLQVATDLITGRHTGAFWAKQRGCSKQRIFEIKQEFLEKSRKILNINAA